LPEAPDAVKRRPFSSPPLEIDPLHRRKRRSGILLIVRSAADPRVSNDEEDHGRGGAGEGPSPFETSASQAPQGKRVFVTGD
jgi:hypothetical protein